MSLLTKGVDGSSMNKTFASAAKKLAVPVDSVRNGCTSLCHLVSQCARMNLGEPDVMDRLGVVGFRESSQAALAALYVDSLPDVRALVTAAPTLRGVSNYADVQWRLDVRTSSRSLTREAEPVFLLELTTESHAAAPAVGAAAAGRGGASSGGGGSGGSGRGSGGGGQSGTLARRLVELDYELMRDMCDELEAALAAADGATARRIKKYVQRKVI